MHKLQQVNYILNCFICNSLRRLWKVVIWTLKLLQDNGSVFQKPGWLLCYIYEWWHAIFSTDKKEKNSKLTFKIQKLPPFQIYVNFCRILEICSANKVECDFNLIGHANFDSTQFRHVTSNIYPFTSVVTVVEDHSVARVIQ